MKKKIDKSNLNKYYTKDSNENTTKNQFKKYFLDAANVFYEDRDTLKELKKTKKIIYYSLPIWFVLAALYILINQIHPFTGECPENATCKVFIRCYPGYELSEDGKSC